jgi:hypothetical protein
MRGATHGLRGQICLAGLGREARDPATLWRDRAGPHALKVIGQLSQRPAGPASQHDLPTAQAPMRIKALGEMLRSGADKPDMHTSPRFLEHQHLVGGGRPLRQKLHVSRLHALDEPLRPEPAGL